MIKLTDKNTKILICCHKPSVLPESPFFLPIHVGKAISDFDLGITGDDTGDNISSKNKNYCELTALYWAWKNIKKEYPDLEYIGLFHYRRFFDFARKDKCFDYVLNNEKEVINYSLESEKIRKLLLHNKFILCNKKIYPYTLQIDYCMCHVSDDFRLLKKIVHKIYPEYDRSFYYIFEVNNKIFPCNMFITSYEEFEKYCTWLFPLLFEIEKQCNIKGYSESQARIYGYMAERLFNLYIYHNSLKAAFLPILWYKDNENKKRSKKKYIIQNLRNSFSAHILYLSSAPSFRTYISNMLHTFHLEKILVLIKWINNNR